MFIYPHLDYCEPEVFNDELHFLRMQQASQMGAWTERCESRELHEGKGTGACW